MEYIVNGKVKVLMDTQTFASGFSKREFVVTTEEQYPQDIKFECVKEKISMLDNLNEGDSVNVSFNLRGNEYQGKYYVNLQAWKVAAGGAAPVAPAPRAAAAPAGGSIPQEESFASAELNEDEIPF